MDEGKEILEGFNAGYLIEKHRPALAKQLVAAVEGMELPFTQGFVQGSVEYTKERIKAKTITKLREASKGSALFPTKNKGKDIDDKDKGIEIDI